MKGIIYAGLLLNKAFFIFAGIVAAVGTALIAVFNANTGDDPSVKYVMSMAMLGLQFVVIAIVEEYLARDFEKNLKSRFADYVLAGMSKAKFVTAELLKNIISMAIAFALVLLMQLVLITTDPSAADGGRILLLAGITILIGALDWTCLPLVVTLKSAEKAGLVVGLILGFAVVMPVMMLYNILGESWGKVAEFFSNRTSFLAVLGVGAAIYALFYFILLNRIKGGDVC